jgi:hypothetical protein
MLVAPDGATIPDYLLSELARYLKCGTSQLGGVSSIIGTSVKCGSGGTGRRTSLRGWR